MSKNENKNIFKEIWQNRQYRASIILILYFVFFGLILMATLPRDIPEIPSESKKNEEEDIVVEPPLESFFTDENYQYQLQIKDKEGNLYEVSVEVVADEATVDAEDIPVELLEDALIFNNKMINRLLANAQLVAQSMNYIEEIEEKQYFVPQQKIEELLFVEETTVEIKLLIKHEKLLAVELLFHEDYYGLVKLYLNYEEEEISDELPIG